MKFDLKKFLAVVGQVGPVVLAAVPGGEKIGAMIPKVVEAIGEAEKIKGASGAEKKRHVMNVVNTAVSIANTTGKVKLDAAEVAAVTSAGIDTVIATVKVIEQAKPDKAASTDVEPAGSAAEATERAAAAGKPATPATAPGAQPDAGNPGTTATPGATGGGHAVHGHGSADD